MTAGAATIRCVLRFTLLAVLSWPAAAHSVQNTGGRIPPTYEELSTSLILNQLAILQLMHDSSNASCAAVEVQREGDAVRKEAERLEEAFGAQVDRVQATLEARLQQMFEEFNKTAQETLTQLREDMREEVASAVLEAQTPTTPITEHPTMEYLGTLRSLCDGNKTLHRTVGALEVVSSGTYPHSTRCSWDIHFPTESSVILSWEYMDVEVCSVCSCDSVTVFDVTNSRHVYGWGLCARNPGSSLLQRLNVSVPGTRNLLVTFRSDSSSTGRGFRMMYGAH